MLVFNGKGVQRAVFSKKLLDKIVPNERLSVTGIISHYHIFDRDFWLDYKALEKVMSEQRFNEIKMTLMRRKRVEDCYLNEVDKTLFITERALLDAEWKTKSEEAKALGTTVHECIHNLFCTNLKELKHSFNVDTDSYTVGQQESFLTADTGLFPEFKLTYNAGEGVDVVGVADLIIKKSGKHVDIVDWKTTEEGIKFRSHYDMGKKKNKCFKYPLSKFEDCSGVQYQLQLSIYAYLLLKLDPEITIDTLKIVWVKDNRAYKEFEVQYLKEDVEKLINWHVKDFLLQKELDKCKLTEY